MLRERINFLPNNPLSGKFKQIAEERGMLAENKVEKILQKMNLRYKRHPRYSKRDRKGIDFEIWIEKYHILINVKSSIRGVKKLFSHNREHKTIVFPLLVRPGDDEHVIEQRIYMLFAKYKRFSQDMQKMQK